MSEKSLSLACPTLPLALLLLFPDDELATTPFSTTVDAIDTEVLEAVATYVDAEAIANLMGIGVRVVFLALASFSFLLVA